MTTTREIYLDNFEKLPESELARLAGVSRQRIPRSTISWILCAKRKEKAKLDKD